MYRMKRFKINLTQHMNEINGVATVILGLAMFIILGLAAYDLRPVTVEKPVKINLPKAIRLLWKNTTQFKARSCYHSAMRWNILTQVTELNASKLSADYC